MLKVMKDSTPNSMKAPAVISKWSRLKMKRHFLFFEPIDVNYSPLKNIKKSGIFVIDTNHLTVMSLFRHSCACLIGLSLFIASHVNAQPLDTLALRAKADSMQFAAVKFAEEGDFQSTLRLFQEISEIKKVSPGEKSSEYGKSVMNLGNCYGDIGDMDKAFECYMLALDIQREAVGEHHQDYAMVLNNLGTFFAETGDFDKAIEYFTKSMDIDREVFGERSEEYGQTLNNLALCYWLIEDYDTAADLLVKTLDIYEEVLGERHMLYARSLVNLGGLYSQMDEDEKAITYLTEAAEFYHEFYGGKHVDYSECLNNLGLCYQNLGDLDKAAEVISESLDIDRVIFGEQHKSYVSTLINLGFVYWDQGNYEAASKCYRDFLSITSKLVLGAFTYLPKSHRSMYWDMYERYFTRILPRYTLSLPNDKEYLRSIYDVSLFYKGLLLNTETEMRRLILENGDEETLALYERLQEERQLLDEVSEIPVEYRPMSVDSLENVCEALERDLQKKSKAFGDYTRNLSISWKDVQSALGKGDIAIEFMEVPINKDSTLYCALTLRPGYDAPRFFQLFDLKDLDALKAKYAGRPDSEGLIYSDKELYGLVWKPLEDELKGVKNIYFGPSGELYQTAIEYADNGKGPVSDKMNIYRLSSTRQLAVARDDKERLRSAVFGGLKYGASEETLLADSRRYARRGVSEDEFIDIEDLDIRGAGGGRMVADLPGTESEALEIDALLRKVGLDNTLRLGDEGTEAAFKDLSGRRENIIHVATHGFYWNSRQSQDEDEDEEEASMTRSGLLFSGANNTLRGGQRMEGVEDGILTAKEIASLDLRGTDLLALSACQTGLGEVSGEGVFGLQRGFKKAGVNTLLMSLWEVDDEATSLLMTSFYKELAKGKSKSEALKAAQKTVRSHKGRDFSSPFYWASFILLDGE